MAIQTGMTVMEEAFTQLEYVQPEEGTQCVYMYMYYML